MNKNILKRKFFTLTQRTLPNKTKNEQNNLQQNQPSCLAALSPAASNLAASPETVFLRFTSHVSLKHKSAFTLAEVLITLGIIGIVAALTLPTLIQNIQDK